MVAKLADPGYAFQLSSSFPSVGLVSITYGVYPCLDTLALNCHLQPAIPFRLELCVKS